MKVVRLQMQREMAQIRIESQRAQLQIETPRREMKIRRQPAQMTLNRQLGSVALDSTALKENTARKDIFALQRQFAAESFENAKQGVERIVQEGDYMAQQPNPGDGRASLALQNMLTISSPVSDRSSVPVSGVEMSGQGGHLDVNWSQHEFEIQWEDYEGPRITINPEAAVHIDVAKDWNIDCEVIEEYIPSRESGQNIDVLG